MRRISLPKRMASAAFAAALACTMCPLVGAGTPDQAYADGARATSGTGSQISVTAPFYIDFTSKGSPYDVSDPRPSLSTDSYFENKGQTTIHVTEVNCEKPQWESGKEVLVSTDSSATLEQQDLFSVEKKDDADHRVNFTYGKTIDKAAIDTVFNEETTVFGMYPGDRLNCTYGMNLSRAQVNPAVADGAANRQSLGTVKFTFSPLDFYFKIVSGDKAGDLYNAAQMKAQAEKISAYAADSANTEGQALYNMYDALIQSDMDDNDTTATGNYRCGSKWGNTWYDIRLIGLNHDDKASESGGKAGFTFQFVNLHSKLRPFYSDPTQSKFTTGWDASQMRADLNEDEGVIWRDIPSDLQRSIETVSKSTVNQVSNGADLTLTSTEDKLFILSAREMINNSNLVNEGTTYRYWLSDANPTTTGAQDEALYRVKPYQDPSLGNCYQYATRSLASPRSDASYLLRVSNNNQAYAHGAIGTPGSDNGPFGVVPAFCM